MCGPLSQQGQDTSQRPHAHAEINHHEVGVGRQVNGLAIDWRSHAFLLGVSRMRVFEPGSRPAAAIQPRSPWWQ
jgi:hypothetical protein